MANKKNREERIRLEKEKRYNIAYNKLGIYNQVSIVVCFVLLLCFFLNWAYVYNTDIKGAEVGISGFNTFAAALSGKYSSPEKIFGDMAMPFYYYAADYCRVLGVLTVIVFFVSVVNMVCHCTAIFKKAYILNGICFLLGVTQMVLFVIVFTVALSMKNAAILSTYCGGNPACSIKSLAIIPAIIAIISTVMSGIAIVKLIKARKLLK